jgi:hypothetical protein
MNLMILAKIDRRNSKLPLMKSKGTVLYSIVLSRNVDFSTRKYDRYKTTPKIINTKLTAKV